MTGGMENERILEQHSYFSLATQRLKVDMNAVHKYIQEGKHSGGEKKSFLS